MYTDYNEDNESYYSDDDNKQQNNEKFKRLAFYILIFVVFLVVILLIAKGCSNNKSNSVGKVTKVSPSIQLGTQNIALNVGEGRTIFYDILNSSNSNPVVNWKSLDSSIAAVNDEGYVTGIKEGSTTIIASYTENNRVYTNTCNVTVTSTEVKLESISVTQKDITLKKGNVFLIEVTTSPSEAKVDKLIYESDDTSIATVDAKGFIKGVGVGTTTITIKTEDGTVSEIMSVTVSEKASTTTIIEPTKIDIAGLTNGLSVGKTAEIVYNITPSSASNKNITWTSSNSSVATVDSNGIVTGVSAGKCTIMATTSNNITGSIEIEVKSNTTSVTGIKIVGSSSISMKVGGTRFLTYEITPSDASNKAVTYVSSNPNVVFVDSSGIMAGTGAGTAMVKVVTKDGEHVAYVNVTVTETTKSETTSADSTTSDAQSSYSVDSGVSGSTYYSDGNTSYSSTTTNSSSCNAYDIAKIQHNESGVAIVSTISFDSAKPFVKANQVPTLEITQIDCVKFLNYSVYYGASDSLVSVKASYSGKILNVGEKIPLKLGKGYYKIVLTGQLKDGSVYLTKTYYAYVQNSNVTTNTSTSDYITVTPTISANTFTIKRNDSKINRVYYCVVSSTTYPCAPSISSKSTSSVYYSYITMNKDTVTKEKMTKITSGTPGYNKGARICFRAYNGSSLVGNSICRDIK